MDINPCTRASRSLKSNNNLSNFVGALDRRGVLLSQIIRLAGKDFGVDYTSSNAKFANLKDLETMSMIYAIYSKFDGR